MLKYPLRQKNAGEDEKNGESKINRKHRNQMAYKYISDYNKSKWTNLAVWEKKRTVQLRKNSSYVLLIREIHKAKGHRYIEKLTI